VNLEDQPREMKTGDNQRRSNREMNLEDEERR
jgi:hypothetical protein